MNDLAAELTTSNTTLSASQLADLQSIAANIGSLGASPYLQYIVNAFVGDNPANAQWTGGGATPTALGALAVGATADPARRTDRQMVPRRRSAERHASR